MAEYLNPTTKSHGQKEYYVTIDSIDRDRTVWPGSGRFEIKFEAVPGYTGANIGRSFKNVASVELLGCSYPTTSAVLAEPCIYLCFDELKGTYEGTNPTSAGAFAKLVPTGVFGGYVQSAGESASPSAPQRKVSYAPGVRLDKLTPTFKTTRGTIVNFGTDTAANVAANVSVQTSITLRVIVNEPYVH